MLSLSVLLFVLLMTAKWSLKQSETALKPSNPESFVPSLFLSSCYYYHYHYHYHYDYDYDYDDDDDDDDDVDDDYYYYYYYFYYYYY